ncbi:MAG: serine--tRNA ligase [Candidatus Diapherotrites archaeon]|nr:serine--tRNA ligase [Candidatus Diapherotrites archaeon]
MLDPKIIRENTEGVGKNLAKRGDPKIIQAFDEWVLEDRKWRELKGEVDDLRAERNKISEEIKIAKGNNDNKKFEELMKKAKELPAQLREKESLMNAAELNATHLISKLPNLLDKNVPIGENEEKNKIVRKLGKPKAEKFELKHHGEFAKELGIADFEGAVKIAGSGFYYLKGDLALLDLALQRFAIDLLLKKGFTLVQPPLMMNRKVYSEVTDLGAFEDVLYKIEGQDLYLIATSEHPLVAMNAGRIFEEKEIKKPILLAGVSPCFRKEVGKHGLDERGFFRVHHFNKVEQVAICKPEDSKKVFESLVKSQEELFKKLKIPYRIMSICSGEIGFVASKKFDLEGWSPREKKYIELGSCSNCTSYQSAGLNIKYKKEDGTKEYVHTLNATMVPTTRTLRAIIENYQTKKGAIKVPAALQKYMNGKKEIKKQ